MLTLTFLGVGSAFAKRNFQSNALVEAWSAGPDRQAAPDDTLLIDFGATGPLAFHQLKAQKGFAYLDLAGLTRYGAIGRVFVTHLHSDHIGGLEELALTSFLANGRAGSGAARPRLVASAELLRNLWNQSLRGGLGVLDGRSANLDDYFEVHALGSAADGRLDGFTMLGRYRFTAFPTDHIRLHRKYDWLSYALLMEDTQTGRTAVYSGDTRFDRERLVPMMATASWTFHEVLLDEEPCSVHTLLSELRSLPEAVRRRTYLYHYADCWDAPAYGFVADEFAGFVRPQTRYALFE